MPSCTRCASAASKEEVASAKCVENLARPLMFPVAADQVQRAEAVDHEPADVAPADAVGDLLKPQHTSIECGTRIDIADKQRSVMQGKRDGHSVTPRHWPAADLPLPCHPRA